MRTKKWLVLLAVAGLALVGCDDDDENGADDNDNGEEAAAELSEEFCQANVDAEAAASAEDPEALQSAIDAAQASAPEDLVDEVETVADGFATDPEAAFEDPAVQEAITALDEAVLDGCGFEVVEVDAQDYEFQGVPDTIEAGTIAFEFSNAPDAEPHEMVVLRINEGVTESAEEILQLPEEEGMTKATPVAFAFASAGETDASFVELESGDYFMACFIPTGSTDETDGEGPPHFVEGMLTEFTVS